MWTGSGKAIPISDLTNTHLVNIINKLKNKAAKYARFKSAQLAIIGPQCEADRKLAENLTDKTVLQEWTIYQELIKEAEKRRINLKTEEQKNE